MFHLARNDGEPNGGEAELSPERQHALAEVLEDIERDGIEIRADAEAEAYLDYCARMQGLEPHQMHAVTLGSDLIMIRPEHATDVRILREEWLHCRQNAAGQVSAGVGGGNIVENEIAARETIIANRDAWCITESEVAEMEREIRHMRQTGTY